MLWFEVEMSCNQSKIGVDEVKISEISPKSHKISHKS